MVASAADTCPFYAPALYVDLNPIKYSLSRARHPLFRAGGWLSLRAPRLYDALAGVIPAMRPLRDYTGWPRSVISENPADADAIHEALRTGPYGRCVYKSDNDVIDHQVVAMEFEDGLSATFSLHGHSHEEGRTIRLDGSAATLLGKWSHSEVFIEVRDHRTFAAERINLPNAIEVGGHGGGDDGLMRAFVAALRGESEAPLTSARASLESHLMAFAAEESRVTGQVIDMEEFRQEVERH